MRSFDEKPLVTKTSLTWSMEKEFSLKKRIRRDRLERPKPFPQAITPPAFLFLISYDVKQRGTEAPKVSIRRPWPRPEVAAYMSRRIARQHSFLRFLQLGV
ncbi:hypothetical protein [Hyphomonas pacifica]|nr:hypothetical protein [Hyphomonas pacifica]